MVEVRDLRKRFGPVAAVDGVSFVAADGQITGLLGENGAGKSTTLAMIGGVLRADGGSVHIDGADADASPHGRRQLGALLDHAGMYSRLTARENIRYFGELHGLSGRGLDEQVSRTLTLLRLEALADRRTQGFSQGERMKVALGRAVVHGPGNLLLDEPTNGLDVTAVRALRTSLREMRDRGICVLFSSHVLDEVRALCDRVVVISRGRVVADDSIDAICRDGDGESLEDAFVRLTALIEERP
jgi:sodium transport system ATP-binding protein